MATARRSQDRAAFTLVELLVVIGIITILAALLTPAIMTAMTKAHEAATLNTIHQVELAAQAFMNDFGEYPPSTWAQFDELFEYDADGDGFYNRGPDEVFFPWADDGIFGLGEAGVGGPPNLDSNNSTGTNAFGISTYNEGIEVLTACLASRNGGPYLEPDVSYLSNTDNDRDVLNVAANASNWLFSPNAQWDELFELTDFWGNPLVYVRNDQYDAHDGWWGAGAAAIFENPDDSNTWDVNRLDAGQPGPEFLRYVPVEFDGDVTRAVPCYARSWVHHYDGAQGVQNRTGNYPNLSEFQIYSWGNDETPGAGEATDAGGLPLDYPDSEEAGQWPGWNADSDNLTNWSE